MENTNLEAQKHNGKATAGLVLGIIDLIAWLIPFFGLPIGVVGLVMSILGRKSDKKGRATAGIILSSIGLIATIAYATFSAYLVVSGKLKVFK